MVVLIVAVILALVFLTWTLCRAAAAVLPMAANLLRRLIRLIGGSR